MSDTDTIEIHFDSGANLEVRDLEERIISGRIVPYNEEIVLRGRPESFARGAFAGINASDVKLLRDHDRTRIVGKAISLEEREDGLYASFKIARTELGDEILQLASEGVLDAFSPGFVPGDQSSDGVHRRVRAMPEVSILPWGAYPSAKVLAVRSIEKESNMDTDNKEEATPLTTEDIAALQTRQDELVAAIERLQASVDAPALNTRSVNIKPVDWFKAEVEAVFEGKMERRHRIQEQFAELQTRALADITGGQTQAGDNSPTPNDLSGLVVEQFVASQVVNILDARRPFFSRLGSFPSIRSGYARIPVVTQGTKVAARTGQKQQANSRKMVVETKTFEAEWVDGAVDVALELIRTAEMPVIQMVWNDLLGQYAKNVETSVVADVEAGGLGFTYTGSALRVDSYANFVTDIVTQALNVREDTDVAASKVAVTKAQWIALVALVDGVGGRRMFTSGDYSDGTVTLTAEALQLPGGIEVFYVPNLTQALIFNEEALRATDYGPERVEATNVALMGKDIGVLGRHMFVPRIPAGVKVFGTDPES